MKIAVSAQEQDLRVHLAAAVLERREFELHVLATPDIMTARQIGASAMLLQAPKSRAMVDESQLRQLASSVPLIVVCTSVDRIVAANYLRIGARGLLLAERSPKTFQAAILAIIDGGSWIDPAILSVLLRVRAPELLDLRGTNGQVNSDSVSAMSSHPASGQSQPLHMANGAAGGRSSSIEFGARAALASDGANSAGIPSSREIPGVSATVGGQHLGEASASLRSAQEAESKRTRLTGRESQVAALIGRGLTNSEIAACLGVDESTVKTHIGSILRKIQLRDRLQIALWFHGLPIGNEDQPVV